VGGAADVAETGAAVTGGVACGAGGAAGESDVGGAGVVATDGGGAVVE
jgi:hypothetical protein